MAPEVLSAGEGSTSKLTHRLWAGDLDSSLSGPLHGAVLNVISPIASDQRQREEERDEDTGRERQKEREMETEIEREREREIDKDGE